MASIFGSIKEAANPFVRMTWNATNDDGSMNVPYFQLEEIKEATFQSDYACDTVFRTLMHRLEGYTAYPIVLSKTLGAIRVLMMEGPSTFSSKMGSASGKLLQIVTNMTDVRRGSVEERNRDLAQAIHQAISGDTRALVRFATDSTDKQNTQATSAGGKVLTAKSDFQAQQEREQKLYRKKVEEEKSKSGVVITSDRQFEVFDASLPPVKLVDSAMQSPKKRFAKEELDAFVSAAVTGERVSDVCTALDAILRDGKASLQNRFKVLTIVEALVVGNAVMDAIAFFRQHVLGLQRHLTIERADNPAKAEAAKAVAHNVMVALQSSTLAMPTAATVGGASRARGASGAGASLPKPTNTAAQLPGGTPLTQQTSLLSSSTSNAPPVATQWQWNGPSQPPSNAGTFDDLFTNLSVKPTGGNPQGSAANTATATSNNHPFTGATAPTRAKQPVEPHHPPAANPWDAWGAGGSGGGGFGANPIPGSYLVSPPLHPSFSGSIAVPPVPNTSLTGANASVVYPVAPNASFASSHDSTASSSLAAPPAPTPPPAATTTQQQDLIRRQMEELQRNMMLMMQQVVQRQQQQQSPPATVAAPAPATSEPQRGPQLSSAGDDAPVTSREGSGSSTRRAAESSEAAEHSTTSTSIGGEAAAGVEAPSSPDPVSPQPHPNAANPPEGAAAVAPNQAVALQMLSQLQAQMEATQRMLAQQQSAFRALQAQLFPNGITPPLPQ